MNIPKQPGIYKLTNLINGKIYIGKSINLKRRMAEHKCCNKHYPIQLAIKKHGWHNFKLEFLCLFDVVNRAQLLDEEAKYIKQFKSTNREIGYNLCQFGTDSIGFTFRRHTLESKAKLSKALKGRKFSQEHKNNMSKSRLGMKYRPETQKRWEHFDYKTVKKPVAQIDKATGKIINIWDSAADAMRRLGKRKGGAITAICKNPSSRHQSAFGFFWKYA